MLVLQVDKDSKESRAKIHSFYLFHSFFSFVLSFVVLVVEILSPSFYSLVYGPFRLYCNLFPLNKDHEGDVR